MNVVLLIASKIGLSLLPVFLFLSALIFLDSYKLVTLRAILTTIAIGCTIAVCAYLANNELFKRIGLSELTYRRYASPLVEELLKAIYVTLLLRLRKIGFMVDAALQGFAIGAGFALVENVYYLLSLEEANLFVWIVRGFGTAVMHGGTTAIFGVIAKYLMDIQERPSILTPLAGLGAAAFVHSAFNHFLLPPAASTALMVITMPVLLMGVFTQSEKGTREWLGVGFDNDAELLTMITTGNIQQTRIGTYLDSLEQRFQGEIIADLLCYLRIYLELAIQAKGLLMMRESGFNVEPDPEVSSKFAELKYLEKNVGKTAMLALAPFLRTSSRDLWQLHMLQS